MPAGRPPKGLKHIEDLEGPEESKHRLRVILETLTGERTIEEACELLDLSEARFHELRHQALCGALVSLAPRHAGRPRKPRPEGASRIEELEHEVDELKVDLQAARVRTEIALVMPHLLQDETGKKNRSAAKARKKRRRRR